MAVDEWAVTFGTARRGLGMAAARPGLALAIVTAHPSTACVPITVLLYNGPLLYGLNVSVKGLTPIATQSIRVALCMRHVPGGKRLGSM